METSGSGPRLGQNQSYVYALQDMVFRFESLVNVFSILNQLEEISDTRLPLSPLCSRLLECVADGVSAENASIMFFDTNKRRLELHSGFSPSDMEADSNYPKKTHFNYGQGIAGSVAHSGLPRHINDISKCPDFTPLPGSPIQIQSLLCYPLILQNDVIGVMNLSHSRPDFFSRDIRHALLPVINRCSRILTAPFHYTQTLGRVSVALREDNSFASAVALFDTTGALVSATPSIAEITGHSLDFWMVPSAAWTASVAPNDRDRLVAHRRMALTGQTTGVFSYTFYQADGEAVTVFEEDYAIQVPGMPQALAAVLRHDAAPPHSERVRLETDLQQIRSQRLQAMGLLACDTAMELNTEWSSLLTYLEKARSESDPNALHQQIQHAIASAMRGVSLTGRLLALDQGDTPRAQRLDLRTIAREAALHFAPAGREWTIEVHAPGELPKIQGDTIGLRQMVFHLCLNAREIIEHALMEGVKGPHKIVIDLALERWKESDSDAVRLVVWHTGQQEMTSLKRPPLFPYETSRRAELGMAVIKDIVARHGGALDTDFDIEGFHAAAIYLPALAPETAVPEPPPVVEPEPPLIMLVEDDHRLREVTSKMIRRLGYRAAAVTSGEEAIAHFQECDTPIHLVILDIHLEGMNGWQTLLQLRDLAPSLPIVMSSGEHELKFDDLAGKYKPSGVLRKPYNMNALDEMIKKTLCVPVETPPASP